MGSNLEHLDPPLLWKYFAGLAAIPRPSKHEERVVAWITAICKEHDLAFKTDNLGNLVVRVPATAGFENAQTVILQSHMDMVCEKNIEVYHDFMESPIQPWVDGDWVKASGTTLGADNGIGLAAALAAGTDSTVKHGPLELLFTVDEETGMTGAGGIDTSLLTGKVMLNLDTEEDGVLCVGCAGGADNLLTLKCEPVAPQPGGRIFSLEIDGLRGGHSGMEIHENRGNALKILTRTLIGMIESGLRLELVDLLGGNMRNAIPRRAVARIFIQPTEEKKFRSQIDTLLSQFQTELKDIDEGLTIKLEPCQHEGMTLSREDRNRFLRLLMVLPDGVLAMSPAIPGLVETSNCLSVVELHDDHIRIVASSRSSLSPALDAVLGSISAAAALAGAEVETVDRYPGWNPDIHSKLLVTMRGVFSEVLNQEPVVNAVHAGLECGLLSQKMPQLDMVSFGPQIEGAHSPDEKANIPSVSRFWVILKRALEVLAT